MRAGGGEERNRRVVEREGDTGGRERQIGDSERKRRYRKGGEGEKGGRSKLEKEWKEGEWEGGKERKWKEEC